MLPNIVLVVIVQGQGARRQFTLLSPHMRETVVIVHFAPPPLRNLYEAS